MKPPNLTFYRGRGHTTTNFPSSFWTWIKSFKNSTHILSQPRPQGFSPPIFWGKSPGDEVDIEQVQIDAIKFDRTQILFFFYRRFHCRRRRPCLRSLILNVVGPGFDSRLKKVLFSVFGRFGFVCLIVVVFFSIIIICFYPLAGFNLFILLTRYTFARCFDKRIPSIYRDFKIQRHDGHKNVA